MGQSLVKNYVHIIFSTKHRKSIIKPPVDKELHAYLGGICNNLECQALAVGGHLDHVHILCLLSKKKTIVELLQKLKTNSSKWIKTKDSSLQSFAWQDGNSAFSVNPREADTVVRYIENQHEHHSKKGFQEELLAFLRQYNVDFEEQYLWE